MDNSSNIYEGITNTATISLDTLILNGVEINSISSNIPSGVNIYDYLQWDGTQYITGGSNNKNIFGKNSNSVHTGVNILNATGNIINTQANNSTIITPLRNLSTDYFSLYNPLTYELSYSRIMNAPQFNTSMNLDYASQNKLLLTDNTKNVISSSYGITDLAILSQNNTFTGLNTFSLGTVSNPAIRWDSDTGFYSSGDGHIDIATNGIRRLGITDRIRTYGYINSTVIGSPSNPNYSFDPDNDTGLYQGSTTGELNFSCNSTQILSMNSSQASFKKSIRTEQGSNLIPSYSFTLDSDTGLYQSVGSNIDFCCNGQNQLNISLQGIKVPSLTASKIVLSDVNQRLSSSTYGISDVAILSLNNTFTGTTTFSGNVLGLTKSMVGLSNVDNTTDLNKPISTATQTALDLKAPIASPTFTGTVSGITKAMVGLSNVDNTTDLNKPISTATQTALNQKAGLSSNNNFTGNNSFGTGNNSFTTTTSFTEINCQDIKLNSGTNGALVYIQPTTKYLSSYPIADLPISTATQTALDLKSNIASPTFTGTLTSPAINLSGQTASKMLRLNGSKNIVSSIYDETNIQAYINQSFDLINVSQTTTFNFTSSGANIIDVTNISTGSIFKGLIITDTDITLTTSFTFTGSISGFTLTTPSPPARLRVGCYISGTGITGGTRILTQITSTTWSVNYFQTVASTTMTTSIIKFFNIIIDTRSTGTGSLGTYVVNQNLDSGTATNATTATLIPSLYLDNTYNYAVNGTVSNPSYTFDGNKNTGLYQSTLNQIDFSCGGVRSSYINQKGFYNLLGTALYPSYSFINDSDTGMFSTLAGNLDFSSDGTVVCRMNTTAISIFSPIRVENGSASNPSFSFNEDTDSGIYRTTNALNMSVNGARHFNVNTSGNVYLGTGTGTGTVSATVNGVIYIGNNTGNSNTKAGTIFTPIGIGYQAAQKNQGGYTVAIGRDAGRFNQGDYAVAIGYGAGQGVDGGQGQHNNSIIINAGTAIINSNGTNRCFINPLRNSPSNLTAVQYDTTTKELVTFGSTRRIKKNIQQKNNFDFNSILKLNIVEFDSIEDDSHNPCGLIAEECYEINPEFACLDSEGIPVSVNYFTLMLYSIEKNKRQEIEIQKLNEEVKTLKNTIEQITIYLQNNSTFVLNKN